MSELKSTAMGFQTQFLSESFDYDGTQLRSLFAYLEHGILGDSCVAWRGPCDVSFAHMVDGEDLRDESAIRGGDMIHFILEKFDINLQGAVFLQRLLSSLALDVIRERAGALDLSVASRLKREGDDLYFGEGKMSISIATVSPMSALIHFAVNVSNDGTPVKTASLKADLGLDPIAFAEEVLTRLKQEMDSSFLATRKVKWVN